MKPKKAAKTSRPATRREPLLRSASWALLLGAVGGVVFAGVQVHWLHGGPLWIGIGALAGMLLGLIAGCDLLIPGPGPDVDFSENRNNRVGPFRWSVMLLLSMAEGLILSAYLQGGVTLDCERLPAERNQPQLIDCRRVATGWFGSRKTGEIIYDNVIAVNQDVHDDLLLQHGPFRQSQSAPGFGDEAVVQLQNFLASQTPSLHLTADAWSVRLGSPGCFLLALLAGAWAFISLRHGLRILREQFELGEVYWGWRKR